MSDLSGFSMLDLFRTEVENQTTILNDGLLSLESQGGSGDVVEPLMRAAHSVKGAARIIGLDVAVKLSHAMEDCFVAAQEGKRTLGAADVDVLLAGVDMLIQISQLPEAELEGWPEQNSQQLSEMHSSLAAVLAGTLEQAAPKAPAEPAPSPTQTPEPTQPQAEQKTQAKPAEPELPSEPTTPPAAAKAPVAPQPAQTQSAEKNADRVVRVTASNMNRLLGLAGETLVQSHWFEPFSQSLLKFRRDQNRLTNLLDSIADAHDAGDLSRARSILTEARQHTVRGAGELVDRLQQFDLGRQRMSKLTERLYREVVSSRMRPFQDGVSGFPRMVRDLTRSLGKKVHFEIAGRDTEVDRDILEKLESPLTHLLRNAIDHGLESPQQRVQAGKDMQGTITLQAMHAAGILMITISDDGCGVDLDLLRDKIVAQDLTTAEMADEMTEQELLEFLFLPSFSTRKEVTETSGRGVGLDVVRNMLQEVGGSVNIETQKGEGTTFRLQLPLTLSVMRTLLVEVSGEPYALPLYRVERCGQVAVDDTHTAENRLYVEMDGRNVGLVPAWQILELPETSVEKETLSIVVLSDRAEQYGLQVDRFLGERELVVRPLDSRLGKVPDVSAAAVMEDGTPLLVLDVDDMIRSAQMLLSSGRLRKFSTGKATQKSVAKRILVVDDSITVREVQRRLLESVGYEVDVAVDGADGWNAVRTGQYDLIISDVDMPRMNGIELVRHIKRDDSLKSLPVMIVSYKEREEDRILGLEAGANYYLTKSSFHDDTLLNAVTDLIGEAK